MIFIIVYALLAIFTARRMTGIMFHAEELAYEKKLAKYETRRDKHSPRDWMRYYEKYEEKPIAPSLGGNFALGLVCGLFWPITWTVKSNRSLTSRHPEFWRHVLASEPSDARKQRQLRAALARTKELEAELGLDHSRSADE